MMFPTKRIFSGRNSFARRFSFASSDGREQQVGDGIGHDAIDLLGHGAVEAAQARLDVGDLDAQLGATSVQAMVELTSPTTTTQSGFSSQADRLELDHDVRGLHRVRAGSDPQIDVRRGNAEFPEENVRHLRIVVLAGVDEAPLDAGPVCCSACAPRWP